MLQNIFQPYLLCKNLLIFLGFTECEGLFTDDWCVFLPVCLTAYLSSLMFIGRGRFIKIRVDRWDNEHKQFHVFCLANKFNTFKCKTKSKTKKRSAFVTLPYVPPPWKGKEKQGYCIFTKWRLCNVQFVAVWTASCRTLFTALISVPCVDEECWNVDCVSSEFRIATLRTHNYNIYWYTYKYIHTCIYINLCLTLYYPTDVQCRYN